MFGKLKDAAKDKMSGNGVLEKAVESIGPEVQTQMQKVQSLSAADVQCDQDLHG